ncbi:MarR family transcriptional regulator [uncultured Paracoccus sp.]|uniref:MarR family winged helix-turn-helix transcriptional regulator n=1 Tax=uncultured Paracoccus sp. TaxID=189685 RepID=UPI0026090255|nr:MarR family transcriptional regulator [uncultured Paracoccus sp.]HMR36369.1 MarR family transcriptional regulator [Paracoccus sp. (in: a-proteobacteria)]
MDPLSMGESKLERHSTGRALASAVLLEKVVRDAYEKRQSSEVQPLQWSILRYLSMSSEDRSTISWIAGFLGITHAPVVRAVKTLQQRNYVALHPNPADGRSKIVRLSEQGLAQLNDDPLLAVAERIEMLAEDEKMALISSVKQLISNRNFEGEESDGVDPSR